MKKLTIAIISTVTVLTILFVLVKYGHFCFPGCMCHKKDNFEENLGFDPSVRAGIAGIGPSMLKTHSTEGFCGNCV